jgi:hypothetical protein
LKELLQQTKDKLAVFPKAVREIFEKHGVEIRQVPKSPVLASVEGVIKTLLEKGEYVLMKDGKEIFRGTKKEVKAIADKLKGMSDDLAEKYLVDLLQSDFLKKIGVEEKVISLFLKGETVTFEFISNTGGYVSGLLTKTPSEIKSYIFYIKDKTGKALRSFLEYRDKSTKIANSFKINTLELGGSSIINKDILEMVTKMEFEKKIIDIPQSLGGKNGEKMEIFVKKFKVK